MKISHGELENCLAKAKEIAEQYRLIYIGSDDPERSADNLMGTCQTYLSVQIELQELAINKNASAVLASCIKNGEKAYTICYVQGLNYCWQRFAICKELFHVLLDKEEYRNMDIDEHIKEVTVAFPDNDSNPSASVRAELLAEIGAIEFMFPYRRREEELRGPHVGNFLAIAEKYKVPQVYVERYLSEPYMEALRNYNY